MSTRVIMWRYGVACLWRRIVTQAARALLRRYQILTGGSADLNDFEKHSLCKKSFAGLPVSKRASERGVGRQRQLAGFTRAQLNSLEARCASRWVHR